MCGKGASTWLTSNTVGVKVAAEEKFEVKKEQKLGEAGTYTTEKLVGKIGETVFYKVTVKDTGSEAFDQTAEENDANCSNIQGPSKTELAVGESAYYVRTQADGDWCVVEPGDG